MEKVQGKCYDRSQMKEAIKGCLGVDQSAVLRDLVDKTKEERQALMLKVRSLVQDEESMCVAEALGIVAGGAVSKQGAEDYIKSIIIKKDLEEKVLEANNECYDLTSGCQIPEVKKQVSLYMGCVRRKMMKLCIRDTLKNTLGVDIEA